MEVTVRLFASLRQHAGTASSPVELPDGATVAEAISHLLDRDLLPRGADTALVAAVGREYVPWTTRLHDGDELALIPPVSGGAPGDDPVRSVRVVEEPLDPGALEALVRDPRAGATVVFTGTTRTVTALEYEAYTEMALEVLERLAREAVAEHGLCAVALEHRIGRVPLAEPSVVVAVSAPHRGEAFSGARWLIDRLKAEAPIWKAEEDEVGNRTWVHGTLPDQSR